MKKQIIMTPGPTPVPEDALLAQAQPMIHHRAPIYTEILLGLIDDLKYVFQTKNHILIFAASGTGAMESAVANLFSTGDKVLVISTGNFGERWAQISEAFGLMVDKLAYDWGSSAVPDDIAQKLADDSSIRGVLMTQSETSTGVYNDVEAIAKIVKSYPETVLVVDAVSGLGATDLKTDQWQVDVVISGSQKALMAPPGLAFACISEKAWSFVERSDLPKFYFSYKKYRAALEKESPQSPFTPAVSTILALSKALKHIREEGLENVFKRHAVLARATRAGIKALGLELFGKEDPMANSVTAIKSPEGVNSSDIVKNMRTKYGITIAGGQGQVKGKIFRIGHCGYYTKFDILTTMSALEMTLKDLDIPVKIGEGVRAAAQVFIDEGF